MHCLEQSEIVKFCAELNHYLKCRYGYKRNFAFVSNGGTKIDMPIDRRVYISVRWKPNFQPWPPEALVIAFISFKSTRQGNGRDFLRFVIDRADSYAFRYICIQETNERSGAFAKKFGFTQVGRHWFGTIVDIKSKLRTQK